MRNEVMTSRGFKLIGLKLYSPNDENAIYHAKMMQKSLYGREDWLYLMSDPVGQTKRQYGRMITVESATKGYVIGLLYRFYIPSVRNLRRCRCVMIPSSSFLVSRGVMEITYFG